MRKALFKVDVGVFCIIGYLFCLFVCRFLRDPNSPSEWHPCLFRTVGGFASFTELIGNCYRPCSCSLPCVRSNHALLCTQLLFDKMYAAFFPCFMVAGLGTLELCTHKIEAHHLWQN